MDKKTDFQEHGLPILNTQFHFNEEAFRALPEGERKTIVLATLCHIEDPSSETRQHLRMIIDEARGERLL